MAGKRILVTGGTGFIGRSIVRALVSRGDAVTVLTRDPRSPAVRALPSEVRAVGYTPLAEGPWCEALAAADAVVHLAGAQAVGVRWTAAKRRKIEQSRVEATRVLVSAMGRLSPEARPKALVGASAVGYYGPRDPGDEVDEASSPGTDYLAVLVARWEAEQVAAASLGLRVVHVRFGIVLGPGGGALERLALPFRFHVGGYVGSGRQPVPWIHVDDACGIVRCAIDCPQVSGPVNVVAPYQVTMRELADAIGEALGRSSYLHVPAWLVRLVLGEGAAPLLTGQRVVSRAACSLGYDFKLPELRAAVADALARR